MTIHKLYEKCGRGENSMLWDALGWCRNRAARKSRAVREIRSEVYSDFGFFGTMLAPRSSGLARKMHFSVGDSFLRFRGRKVALVEMPQPYSPPFERNFVPVTVEDVPTFLRHKDFASPAALRLSREEAHDIKQFVAWNKNLILAHGTESENAPDSADFIYRAIKHPRAMDFAGISVHAKADDDGFAVVIGVYEAAGGRLLESEPDFAVPHAYIWTKDGTLATRFRIESEEPPESAADLRTLFDTDAPLAEYAKAVLTWCKEPPRRHYSDERTNWDALRTSFRDEMEMRRFLAEKDSIRSREAYEKWKSKMQEELETIFVPEIRNMVAKKT